MSNYYSSVPIISTICGENCIFCFLQTSSGQNYTLNFVNETSKCENRQTSENALFLDIITDHPPGLVFYLPFHDDDVNLGYKTENLTPKTGTNEGTLTPGPYFVPNVYTLQDEVFHVSLYLSTKNIS